MRAVASRDEIASDLLRFTVLTKPDGRLRGRFRLAEIANAYVFHIEKNLPSRCQSRLHQIFDHFVLRVNHDAAPAGKLFEIDMVRAPRKPQVHPVMNQPFPPHPLARADFLQQINRALLQHACAHAFFAIFPAASLDHHRLDALPMQQVREHQPRGSRSDNSYLCSHGTTKSFL